MLQPRSYPTLIGKALVLEPEAFATLAGDDEPVVEGAFLTLLIGLLAGVAQIAGGLLYSWSMPAAASLDVVVSRAASAWAERAMQLPARALEQGWLVTRLATGHDTGWARALPLIWEPFLLLALWLLAGALAFAVGRALGGRGTLPRVLGAAALAVAPQVLAVVSVLPFVRAGGLLTGVWGLLLLYRAVQVAHDLPWKQAALTATIAGLLVLVLGAFVAASAGALLLFL